MSDKRIFMLLCFDLTRYGFKDFVFVKSDTTTTFRDCLINQRIYSAIKKYLQSRAYFQNMFNQKRSYG